ncbi:hypothetical protein [Actinopolymorpha pittospori]
MARRNISIPDALVERLDRMRDRINVSRVCAVALERELRILEGQARGQDVDESKVDRLVERLRSQQSEKDRWYRRGLRDGEKWAQETATLHELAAFEDDWAELEQIDVADFDPEDIEGWDDELPETFQTDELLRQPPLFRSAYVLGWYAGVHGLWRAARVRL